MNPGDLNDDDLSPAERGLSQHLELLRASPPTGGAQFVTTVIRGVRWQRAVRDPLVLIGAVASALADGLGLLFKPPEGGS